MKNEFLDHLQHEKRYSGHTITSYDTDLRQFKDYLVSQEDTSPIAEVDSIAIRNWIVHLLESDISPRSVTRKISTLKSFFKYLKREGGRKDNPLAAVVVPKTSKRLPEFVEQSKMQGLFESNGLFNDDFDGKRDRVLVQLFYSTGLRLSELIGAKLSDYSKADFTLRILGKRNKERIVPLGVQMTAMIEEYLSIRREEGLDDSMYLIVRDKGQKLYDKFVYRKVNSYLGKVTTLRKKSPHVLRHTFATHMLNNGADIHAIKEILGHSSLAATQVYTHNTIEKLKNIHQQAHPRG